MNSNTSVSQQKAMLDSWYQSMKAFDYDQADMKKKKIESSLAEFISDPVLQKLYQLFRARYCLLYNDLKKASGILAEIEPFDENKFHWLNYFYYFFNGILQYELKNRKVAIDSYTKAKTFISDIEVEETAELLYKLASAYNKDYQYSRSIKYVSRSLEIFLNKPNLKRLADCENLLGINYMNIYDYKKAENHYKTALSYADELQNISMKAMILHNLGILYTEINEMDSAINSLYQAYVSIPEDDKYFQCQNLFILARSYFSVESTEKAMSYLNKGLALAKECGHLDYYYHFKILQVKHIESESQNFEKIYKEGIAYFNDHEEWDYVTEFSEELAIHLRGKEKHKESVQYFKLAVDAKEKRIQ